MSMRMWGSTADRSPGGAPGRLAVISVEPAGRVALLRVAGELDLSMDEALADALTVARALAGSLLVVELASCAFVGVEPFEAIERAACALHDRGAQLVVRMPPTSFLLIGAHRPPGHALVIARPVR